jgi:prevent-host-death family protein
MAGDDEPIEVAVRELTAHLSRYLSLVQAGEEVIVTKRGTPVARLAPLDPPSDRLADLIASGAVRPAKRTTRHRLARRITPRGSVSDLVAEQRR